MTKPNDHSIIYLNGFTIETWSSRCKDPKGKEGEVCGFISGMGLLTYPNGKQQLWSGAGCHFKRDPERLKKLIDGIIYSKI